MFLRFYVWLTNTFVTAMGYPPDNMKTIFVARAKVLGMLFAFFFFLFAVLGLGSFAADLIRG